MVPLKLPGYLRWWRHRYPKQITQESHRKQDPVQGLLRVLCATRKLYFSNRERMEALISHYRNFLPLYETTILPHLGSRILACESRDIIGGFTESAVWVCLIFRAGRSNSFIYYFSRFSGRRKNFVGEPLSGVPAPLLAAGYRVLPYMYNVMSVIISIKNRVIFEPF